MIKNLKIELILIALTVLIVFVVGNIEYKITHIFYVFLDTNIDIYIKQFFTSITTLGDSFWIFSSCILVCFFSFFLKDKNIFYKKIFFNSFFLLSATLITGLITQIIKHLIGRPRPNHTLGEGFNFLNFDSSFHSFPSGHTSTIFIVALVFSMFTPRLKYFYFCCASIIALSRVIVGAHFLTDIIGGVIVSFVGFKITLAIFKQMKFKENLGEVYIINTNIFHLILVVFLSLIALITVGSTIDIYLSSLFYGADERFVLQSYYLTTRFVREFVLPAIILYLLLFPAISLYLPLKKIYFNFSLKKIDVLFIFLSFSFNLLIVVNLILKNTWGRARPNDILQLGGEGSFTPWFQISDSCIRNCSFVSGDASVGFSIIALFFITKKTLYLWLSLFFGLLFGTIRILEGGHFISDVLISGFLIFILTYFEFYFYNKKFSKNVS